MKLRVRQAQGFSALVTHGTIRAMTGMGAAEAASGPMTAVMSEDGWTSPELSEDQALFFMGHLLKQAGCSVDLLWTGPKW